MNSSADDAERIYNGVAKCLNCDHAGDMACLRTKSMDEIYNCTWTTEVKVEISLGQCIDHTGLHRSCQADVGDFILVKIFGCW